MDDEDSQDELINKNISNGKSKRPSASILSDEEENGDDSLEEGSDSEEDDFQDEGVEEENDDEEDESDHEDGVKEGGEALETEPTDLGLSSDEDAEKCPICLNSFHDQPVATPQNCEHYFCLDCILEWAKNANSCPVDRRTFSNILLRNCYGGKVQKTITVQRPVTQEQEEQVNVDLEQTSCEVCGGTDREDRLLLCDGCDAGYHMECLTPPLDAVPVEEWFCPECSPNSPNRAAERLSEEESSLPTTSRSRSAGARPMRAIARTQHSERVRANVNRHRITQARTAAQLAPQYLMRSTWLDETINAVVAGLNTAVYVRDLTPRSRTRRRHKRAPRKKYIKEGKDVKGKTSTTKVKRRKRKARRSRSKKAVVKKRKTAQGRIAQSMGMKKPVHSSTITSVYRPCEQTLGSMRADIGAASLSIYGDPFDLDPFDNGDEEMEHASVQPSLLEAKRWGLSRSALRSHQPVARPILAGMSRRGSSIPQVEEMAEAAPVPDLLGSILSGQSLLLMDSSDVVINRDGTLKALKPACLSSSRDSITASEPTLFTGSADLQSIREPLPSTSPFTNVSQTSIQPTPSRVTNSTSCPSVSHAPTSVLEQPQLSTLYSRRPLPTNSTGTGHSQLHTCSIRGQPSLGVENVAPGSLGERQSSIKTSAKKPPPKPVWVDVSVLPRIPKIKRENTSVVHGSRESNCNNLPESSMTSLAGDKGRQNSVDQKASESRQSKPIDGQRLDRAVSSPSFSNSFSTPSTSASLPSNSQTPSSAVSFRIKSSGNPWQARRLSVPGETLPAKNKDEIKREQKDKRMFLSSYLQTKKTSVESEVYDPFNPTGSDASDSDDQNEKNMTERKPQVQNEDAKHEIKESMDLHVDSKISGKKIHVKEEPASPESDSWSSPPHQSANFSVNQSQSLATSAAYGASPVVFSDVDNCKHSEGQLTNTLDNSESSLPSRHYSDKHVKIEVKSEPDQEPSSKKSPAVFQVTKGFIHKQSSVSESSDVNYKCKEKEQSSSCSSSAEEKRLPCVSNSSLFKDFQPSDKQKKRLRPEDRRHSQSRSPHRRQFCSRSQEESHIRDRGRSARSSSSDNSSKRTKKHESRDRYDSKEKDGQKRSGKKRYAHSRSRSRSRSRSKSRELRREKTLSHTSSSRLSDKKEVRSDRKRSRSTSRDRRRKENVLENFPHRHRQTDKGIESTSAESKEFTCSIGARKTNTISVKDSKKGHNECDATLSVVTIKKEAGSRIQEGSQLIDESKKQISEDFLSIRVSHKLHKFKPIDIKEEKDSPISNIKEFQPIKDKLPKQIKIEQIWPDEDSCSDDDALVINLSPSGPASSECEKMVDVNSTNLPVVPKEEIKVEHPQAPCSVKHETVNSSDEEINVDYLIDNLDFIKKEIKDEPVANTAGGVEPQADMVKESTGVQQEMESVSVIAGTKTKSQGKRVTWNIQEPVVSQPDKMSKLALFKLKLKQEGSRKAALSSSVQIISQVAAAVPGGSKSAATSINSLALEEESNSGRKKSKSGKGERLVNPDQKDKYMKKLHMQERAIEEVKLAIKPFYQKRDITKEEYKEILRKAVQKVCHSKSGEINPVKVANLVKAYVDKYKHARKHLKADDQQHAEEPKASETPA